MLAAVVRHPSTNTIGSAEEVGVGGSGVVDVWREEKRRIDKDEEDDDVANMQATSSARRLASTELCKYVGAPSQTGAGRMYLPYERMYAHDIPERTFYTPRFDALLHAWWRLRWGERVPRACCSEQDECDF